MFVYKIQQNGHCYGILQLLWHTQLACMVRQRGSDIYDTSKRLFRLDVPARSEPPVAIEFLKACNRIRVF